MALPTADSLLDDPAPAAAPSRASTAPDYAAIGQAAGLPDGLFPSVIHAESNGRQNAVSKKGAVGASQVLPTTAASPGFGLPAGNPRDPATRAAYLKKMIDLSGGDIAKGIARFNAGPNGHLDNPETKQYVDRVLKQWQPPADDLLGPDPAAHAAGGEALSSLSKGPQAPVHGQVANPFQQQQPAQPAQPPVDRTPQLAALPPAQLASAVQKVATAPNGSGGLNAALNLVGLPSMIPQPQPQQPAEKLQAAGAGLGAGFGETMLSGQSLVGRGLSAVGAKTPGDWLQQDAAQGTAKLQQQQAANTEGHPTIGKVANAVGGSVPYMVAPGGLAGQVATGAGLGAGAANVAGGSLYQGALEGAGGGAAGHYAGKLIGAGVDVAARGIKYLPGLFTPKAAQSVAKDAAPAAKAAAQATEQATHPIADGAAGPEHTTLPRATPGQSAASLSDQLTALEGNQVARKMQWIKDIKTKMPADYIETDSEIYHALEGDKAPLSEKAALYKRTLIDPIARKNALLRDQLKAYGVNVGEDVGPHYVPRKRIDKMADTPTDASIDFNSAPRSRGFSTTADSLKERTTMSLTSSNGERMVGVVNTKTGEVQGWRDGKLVASRVVIDGKTASIQGTPYSVGQATTKEIEAAHPTIRYRQSAAASVIEANTQLSDALSNAKFLNGLKTSPEWKQSIVPKGQPAPSGFRAVTVPGNHQLDGWLMHPRLADTIEDFVKVSNGSALSVIGSGINRIASGSLFWNPLPHLWNVLSHAHGEEGLVGGVMEAGREVKRLVTPGEHTTMFRAIKSVVTQDTAYLHYLKEGAGLKLASVRTRDFSNNALKQFVQQPEAAMVARAWGYVNPVAMVKAVYGASNHALWAGSDMLMVRAYMEKELAGQGVAEAISHTERHVMNYRVPSQLFGDLGDKAAAVGAKVGLPGVGNAVGKGINIAGRASSEALQNPNITQFGRYSHNRLASLGAMALDLISRDTTIVDKAKALDQVAALLFQQVIVYPALDQAVKAATGNPHASITRSGPIAVTQTLWDWMTGKADSAQVVQQAFRPSPGPRIALEEATNRNSFSGKNIRGPGGEGQIEFLLNQSPPIADLWKFASGKQGARQLLLRQLNIKDPTEEQVARAQKWIDRRQKMKQK